MLANPYPISGQVINTGEESVQLVLISISMRQLLHRTVHKGEITDSLWKSTEEREGDILVHCGPIIEQP